MFLNQSAGGYQELNNLFLRKPYFPTVHWPATCELDNLSVIVKIVKTDRFVISNLKFILERGLLIQDPAREVDGIQRQKLITQN